MDNSSHADPRQGQAQPPFTSRPWEAPGPARDGYGPGPEHAPDAEPPTMAQSLEDIVALVPHRMGFYPVESVAIVLLDERQRWMATARRDWTPDVSASDLARWVEDVSREGHSFIAGFYGPGEASKLAADALHASLSHAVAAFVVAQEAWWGRTWGPSGGMDAAAAGRPNRPDSGWVRGELGELVHNAAHLDEWGEGSLPTGSPRARDFVEPSKAEQITWAGAALVVEGMEAQIDLLMELALDAEEAGDPECAGVGSDASPEGHGSGADLDVEWYESHAVELARRALFSWALCLDRVQDRPHIWDWAPHELEELAFGMHSLRMAGIRDMLLTVAACSEEDVDPAKVLVGQWAGPVDAAGLHGLGILLQSAGGLMPRAVQAEALCLLAWLEWAKGHGSVAGATVALAKSLAPEHRLARVLDSFLDVGMIPLWLRPSQGGRGSR